MSKNIKAVPTSDYTAVIGVAQEYVDGLRIGSADDVAKAFHKDAVIYGFTNGELLGGTINNLFAFVQKMERHLTLLRTSMYLQLHQAPRSFASIWRRMRLEQTTMII